MCEIEADWLLLTTCNFRCTYCFFDHAALSRRVAPRASAERLAAFFDGGELAWCLHLTGGEPFCYPELVELARLLTRRQRISVNTNADSERVLDFAARVDPARVSFVNCSLHPEQRLQRDRLARFERHVRALRDGGFFAFVSCVMHPQGFDTALALCEQLAAQGVAVWPKTFRGAHEGQRYPAAYTDEQRRIFVALSQRAEAASAGRFAPQAQGPTINPLVDRERFLYGVPEYRGAACRAGHDFVTIWPDGSIRACASGPPIGHVVEGWFGRGPGLPACRDSFCPYYCERHSAAGRFWS